MNMNIPTELFAFPVFCLNCLSKWTFRPNTTCLLYVPTCLPSFRPIDAHHILEQFGIGRRRQFRDVIHLLCCMMPFCGTFDAQFRHWEQRFLSATPPHMQNIRLCTPMMGLKTLADWSETLSFLKLVSPMKTLVNFLMACHFFENQFK